MGSIIEIDDFKVDVFDEIGRGSCGTVYRAEDQSGSTVAAKHISKDISSKITDIESDIVSYRSRGLNDHPNILKMLHIAHHRQHFRLMEVEQ